MPPPYSLAAQKFGNDLENEFAAQLGGVTKAPEEIKKFEALIRSFDSIGGAWHRVESYHGARSQVTFPQITPWTRSSPRCELSDVLFVVYGATEIRLSFLQAKAVCAPKSAFPVHVANAEQYAILAKRPNINSWINGQIWPDDILQSALLPSVGSFGIFFDSKSASGANVDFCYAVADQLKSVGTPTKLGRYMSAKFELIPFSTPARTLNGFNEILRCDSLAEFGSALYSMEIGTPIHPAVDSFSQVVSGPPYSLSARLALASWLGTQAGGDNLLGPLRSLLAVQPKDVPQAGTKAVGARHVVVIQVQDDAVLKG